MASVVRFLFVIVVLTTSTIAIAGDPFDEAYDAGSAAYNAKDYAKAHVEFQKALAIRPTEAIVIYNVAQTYRSEGKKPEAIDWYKRYIAATGTDPVLVQKSKDYVTELEKALAPRVVEPPPPPPKPKTEEVRTRRIPFGSKIAAGVTGVGVIASIIFTKRGLDKEKDFKDLGTTATPDDANDVESAQNLINISWGITAAAAVTSVVLYFVAPSYKTETRNVTITPNRDGGVSAAFSMRF